MSVQKVKSKINTYQKLYTEAKSNLDNWLNKEKEMCT